MEKKKRTLEVLNTIIDDCMKDVEQFEKAPFTGHTVGTIHGLLEAKIMALAAILRDIVESK